MCLMKVKTKGPNNKSNKLNEEMVAVLKEPWCQA